MKKNGLITAEYSLAQALYWMGYGSTVAFAAVYLQNLGFSNTELGIVLGVGYGFGCLLSNLLGSWIDRSLTLTASKTVALSLLADGMAVCYLLFFGANDIPTMIACGLQISMCIAIGAVLTKQWADLAYCGYKIDFGVPRAIGSLAFTCLVSVLGTVAEKHGVLTVYPIALGCIAGELAINFLLSRKTKLAKGNRGSVVRGEPFTVFVRQNGLFCLLMLGTACIFFAHKVPDDYMINVVKAVGADTAAMGTLRAFTALLEVPTMLFLYHRVAKRVNGTRILTVAFAVFAVKALAFALAPSMVGLYGATCLQVFSFAMYTPAIVDYVNGAVSYENSAKGQTMANSMIALGSVFSSFIGGVLLDRISVKGTLFIATGISLIGAGICIFALQAMAKQKKGA